MGVFMSPLIAVLLIAAGAEIPLDIWSGKLGGYPAITAGPDGISVVIQAEVVGGRESQADLTALVKSFLETYGPSMCSDVFDFNVPHPKLSVMLDIQAQPYPGLPFYQVVPEVRQVVFDYAPAKHVNCVRLEEPMS